MNVAQARVFPVSLPQPGPLNWAYRRWPELFAQGERHQTRRPKIRKQTSWFELAFDQAPRALFRRLAPAYFSLEPRRSPRGAAARRGSLHWAMRRWPSLFAADVRPLARRLPASRWRRPAVKRALAIGSFALALALPMASRILLRRLLVAALAQPASAGHGSELSGLLRRYVQRSRPRIAAPALDEKDRSVMARTGLLVVPEPGPSAAISRPAAAARPAASISSAQAWREVLAQAAAPRPAAANSRAWVRHLGASGFSSPASSFGGSFGSNEGSTLGVKPAWAAARLPGWTQARLAAPAAATPSWLSSLYDGSLMAKASSGMARAQAALAEVGLAGGRAAGARESGARGLAAGLAAAAGAGGAAILTGQSAAYGGAAAASPAAAQAGAQALATGAPGAAGPTSAATIVPNYQAVNRLAVMDTMVKPTATMGDLDTASAVQAQQWDSDPLASAQTPGPTSSVMMAAPILLSGDNGESSDVGGDTNVPAPSQPSNSSPWQGLVTAATTLMTIGGILLGVSSLLVFIGKKLLSNIFTAAIGQALITTGMVMAYTVLGMAAAVTALGVAILAEGQTLQGAIFTLSGAAMMYGAYKAAQGDQSAEQGANQAEQNAGQSADQAQTQELSTDHVDVTAQIDPVPTEDAPLPDTLDVPTDADSPIVVADQPTVVTVTAQAPDPISLVSSPLTDTIDPIPMDPMPVDALPDVSLDDAGELGLSDPLDTSTIPFAGQDAPVIPQMPSAPPSVDLSGLSADAPPDLGAPALPQVSPVQSIFAGQNAPVIPQMPSAPASVDLSGLSADAPPDLGAPALPQVSPVQSIFAGQNAPVIPQMPSAPPSVDLSGLSADAPPDLPQLNLPSVSSPQMASGTLTAGSVSPVPSTDIPADLQAPDADPLAPNADPLAPSDSPDADNILGTSSQPAAPDGTAAAPDASQAPAPSSGASGAAPQAPAAAQPAAGAQPVQAVQTGYHQVTVTYSDGTQATFSGNIPNVCNNPGDMTLSQSQVSWLNANPGQALPNGAIGYYQGSGPSAGLNFAIFPDGQTGQNALSAYLGNLNPNMTLQTLFTHNFPGYLGQAQSALGGLPAATTVGALSSGQLSVLQKVINVFEGFKGGGVIP